LDLSAYKGKTALITGAARRIGRAIALDLAARGINIIAHYHTSALEMDELINTLKTYNVKAFPLKADLASAEAADILCRQALQLTGNVDILINNASIFPESTLLDFSGEELAQNININSFAPLLLARCLFRRQQGVIINLLDTRIRDYDREHAAYHLSKRMLFDLTRMLAVEFAPLVRVNAIAPGAILPPAGADPSAYNRMIKTNPLQTHGCEEDITEAVAYLLGSRFVTGQVLYIDGGRHLRGDLYGE